MEITTGAAVVQSFRTPYALGHVQPAICSRFVALPFVRTSLGVWPTTHVVGKPLELDGHACRVSALRFGQLPNGRTLLASAGNDYVLLWTVEECLENVKQGQAARGRILAPIGGSCVAESAGLVSHLSLDSKCNLLAACVEWTVRVWDITSKELRICLEGHDGRVTCAEFIHFWDGQVLITGSEDRTFKLWNLLTNEVLYQSSIMSPSPFTCISLNSWDQEAVLGTSDGSVYFIELPKLAASVRFARKLDISRALSLQRRTASTTSQAVDQLNTNLQDAKLLSSRPSWQQLSTLSAAPPTDGETSTRSSIDVEAEASEVVLSIHFACLNVSQCNTIDGEPDTCQGSSLRHLLQSRVFMVIATTTALIYVDARSSDIISYVDLNDVLSRCSLSQEDRSTPALLTSAVCGCGCFADDDLSTAKLLVLLGSQFDSVAHLCRADLPVKLESELPEAGEGRSSTEAATAPDNSYPGPSLVEISMTFMSPLLSTSPLNKQLTPKLPEPSTKGVSSSRAKSNKKSLKGASVPSVLNQPLTVHGKVKSSGYAQAEPRRTMFKPLTSTGSVKAPISKVTAQVKSEAAGGSAWGLDASAPGTILRGSARVDSQAACINSLRFSPSGQQLLCALSNKSAVSLKVPLVESGDSTAVFSGHNGAVTCASWSRDGLYAITGSADRTAAIWAKGQSDPLMEFTRIQDNLRSENATSQPVASEFSTEIRHAQFYYMDRFVLLASSNSLRMYACHLDPSKDDVQRYKGRSKYRLSACLTIASAQAITAAAAINEFYSYIVLCAGSDRSIEVFDLNVNQSVRTIPDAHTRQAHAIKLYEGAPNSEASAGQATYDLFLTSAMTDGIKLWDLRASRCVARYDHHKCRAVPCGLSWSPCGRFIATGSEDKTAYVIDLAAGQVVTRIGGHSDIVTCVAFHPHRREVATGCSSGLVQMFS